MVYISSAKRGCSLAKPSSTVFGTSINLSSSLLNWYASQKQVAYNKSLTYFFSDNLEQPVH